MRTVLDKIAVGLLCVTIGACGASGAASGDPADDGKADGEPNLNDDGDRSKLVTKAATCPFMRAAVALKKLRIGGTVSEPVGNTADVVALGNAGGGSLGLVLAFFAAINHNELVGENGRTFRPVPEGTFGLWFPGSGGSHPGHSGILQGDPTDFRSGGRTDWRLKRLTEQFSVPGRDGRQYLTLESIGAFVKDNIYRDPNSRGVNLAALASLGAQVAELGVRALSYGPFAFDQDFIEDVFHLVVTGNDLGNSAGEFALLFTRFADATDEDGLPMVSTDVVNSLFRDGVFPKGWDARPASAWDWAMNTLRIAKNAIL